MNLSGAIVGDIGGTNARFAWLDETGHPVGERTLPVADHAGIVEAIEAFAADRKPEIVCLAVACPVDDDWIHLTNAPWAFSKRAVTARLGLHRLEVINDFTAQALALPHLTADMLAPVGPEIAINLGKPLAVLGPGTGLGVSGMFPAGGTWIPISGEGGHIEFPARSDLDWEIRKGFAARYGRVSAERILSGSGLADLFAIMEAIAGRPPHDPPSAPEITRAAIERDGHERAAVNKFLEILGVVAGDLVLTLGAYGGTFIAGGIVPRLLPLVAESGLREAFLDKGRMGRLLVDVPLAVVTAKAPALVGDAAHLRAVLR